MQSVCALRRPLPRKNNVAPQGIPCRHKHHRVLGLLRQGEELLAQGVCRLELGTHIIMIATDHAARGKAAEDRRGVDRDDRAWRVRLSSFRSPSAFAWQSAMRPRRYTCLLRVGYAQVSRGTSGATPALDGDGQSLPHRLSARWLVVLLAANRGLPALSALPRYNAAPGVRAVPQRSLGTGLPSTWAIRW